MEWLSEDDESFLGDPQFSQLYSQSLVDRISVKILSSIQLNVEYWVQMGLSRTKMDERAAEIEEIFVKVCRECNDTERHSFDKLKDYNQTKYLEINAILSDLSLDAYELPNDLSLLKQAKLLYFKYDELGKIKSERMTALTELKSLRAMLCCSLNINAKPFTTATNIPNERELSELRQYVNDLNKEKAKRLKSFQATKQVIIRLFDDLERVSANEFETEILRCETESFILSDENMKKLKNLHHELESQYCNNDKIRKEYQQKLSDLYERLEVSKSHRDLFLANDIGCKPSVLEQLKNELEIHEALKRANIERFTLQIRSELVEWYEKCCVSDTQKNRFTNRLGDCNFTEKLLEEHENELKRLKTFYYECEAMFTKLNKWKEQFKRSCQLDYYKWNPDKDRLNNRRGILLREERERTAVKNSLRALQDELNELSRQRFQQTGQQFLVYGSTIEEYIGNELQQYENAKENEKKERQNAKQNEFQAQLKGKKVTPSCGMAARRTPVKRALAPISPNCGESGCKSRRMGAPLTPSQLNNAKPTHYPTAMPRNLANQMNQLANEVEGSLLSINESDFQVSAAPLCERDNANSTFISCPRKQTPVKPAANITNRRHRIPQIKNNLNRRKSRSCSDLAETMKASLKIGVASRVGAHEAPLGTIRSNPVSPHPKANGSATPNRFPRFAVAQRKPPFVV